MSISSHSIDDSVKLAGNLGVKYDILPIETVFNQFRDTLLPLFGELPEDVTEENIQARIRGALLMALSNKFGNILLNTSNKSETAVGYGTLYGDMSGGLSVLGDVYKTDVYLLAKHFNREKEVIPENIITKPPSAELRPDQKDTDSLPDGNGSGSANTGSTFGGSGSCGAGFELAGTTSGSSGLCSGAAGSTG